MADATARRVPLVVYVLGLLIFCVNTAEVMAAGLLPSLSGEFGVSISAAGWLVGVYAAGMAVGGPILTALLTPMKRKNALLLLSLVFLLGQTLGAVAPTFPILLATRALAAVAAGAVFGTVAAICAETVAKDRRARALSVVFGGLMLAQVAGVPLAAWIDQHWDWRASFWAVDLLAALATLAAWALVRQTSSAEQLDLRGELRALRNRKLWIVYGINALNMAAVYAAYSYLAPVFTQIGGFPGGMVAILFLVYGIATLIGNVIVGRIADRHPTGILAAGQAVLAVALALIAALAQQPVLLIVGLVLFGLSGLPLSSARGARVMAVAAPTPLVSTLNTSVLAVGIVLGSWVGGTAIEVGGYRGPAWVGAALALACLLCLMPDLIRRPRSEGQDGSPAEGAKPDTSTNVSAADDGNLS
ncbi:MFS transporter [Brevibacterium casei]|uniref:MFS transporter n=1 Tax=Brevibacterium casei TaxID=33889 RepID=UPI003F7E2B98